MLRRALSCSLIVIAVRLPAQEARADSQALFVRPSGPYRVGTTEFLWVDENRPETFTKAPRDRRRLTIQVWYPAEPVPRADRARYISTPAEFGPTSVYKPVENATTNSFRDAPLAKSERPLPILIYHHGAGWSRFTGTFVTEALASHGYVVFSVEHPGTNRSIRFPDGTAFLRDTLPAPLPQNRSDQDARTRFLAAREYTNTFIFSIWLDDSRFVIDKIEQLNRTPGTFRQRLDLDRLGMFGWSFGGATAIEMARVDSRVKAAVSYDASLYGGATTQPIPRPFMMFRRGVPEPFPDPGNSGLNARAIAEIMVGYDSVAKALSINDWYEVVIPDTRHATFSDLPLLEGPESARRARRPHEIIVAYSLAFFDRYIKGRNSPILESSSAQYPEVILRRK